MYSFNEIRQIFARCRDHEELTKACEGFVAIINDRDFSPEQEQYTKKQAQVRFRQLKV